MQTEQHPAYILYTPDKITAPVFFENPHSTPNFEDFFEPACDPIHIERQTDLFLDDITDPLATHGYSVLKSAIPRCYIDFNRATNSVHSDHVKEGTFKQLTPNPDDNFAKMGLGLVHTFAYLGEPRIRICKDLPTEDDIIDRINTLWVPYHDKITDIQNAHHKEFNETLMISCHSFPLANMKEKDELEDYTFFIGTKYDTTCAPDIKHAVMTSLENQGFKVIDNHILTGAELVRRHGTPDQGRHALQIEISRDAYMDNDTLLPHAGLDKIKDAFRIMADDLSTFMTDRNHRQIASSSSSPLPDPARPSSPSAPIPSP
jgi:N-formylglutamate deformylase